MLGNTKVYVAPTRNVRKDKAPDEAVFSGDSCGTVEDDRSYFVKNWKVLKLD